MKKRNVFLTLLITVAVLPLMVGSFTHKSKPVEVSAAAPQTHRRVYAYYEQSWDNPGNMYIHYWGGSGGTNWEKKPAMTRVLSDYWDGLFYYDVPIDHTTVMFASHEGNTDKDSNQTVDIPLSNLFDSGYKAAKIPVWPGNDGTKRTPTFTGLPMDSPKFGAILGHINTCSPNYASGYNSYPQLESLIIQTSTIDRNQQVYGVAPFETGSPTIGAKLDYMQMLYNQDQGSGSPAKVTNNDDNSLMATVIIGVIGLSTLAGYYFLQKKKTVHD